MDSFLCLSLVLGRVKLNQRIKDESDMNESGEHGIEFFETGEDPPKALEPAEKPLHLIAPLVEFPVVFPWIESITFGRHHRFKFQIEGQLPGFVVLVGPVHDQGAQGGGAPLPTTQELAALGPVGALARREGET